MIKDWNINDDSIIKKWSFLIDNLIPNCNKDKKDKLCMFLEQQSQHPNDSFEIGSGDKENLLPVQMKIASKLTELDHIIKNKQLFLLDKPIKSYSFDVDIDLINLEKLEDKKELIKSSEEQLVNKVVNEINYILRGAKGLRLFSLCTELKIELFDNNVVKMIMKSDFDVIGSREDKLERINNE